MKWRKHYPLLEQPSIRERDGQSYLAWASSEKRLGWFDRFCLWTGLMTLDEIAIHEINDRAGSICSLNFVGYPIDRVLFKKMQKFRSHRSCDEFVRKNFPIRLDIELHLFPPNVDEIFGRRAIGVAAIQNRFECFIVQNDQATWTMWNVEPQKVSLWFKTERDAVAYRLKVST